MEDSRIVDLYWCRDARAVEETQAKYGRYCYSVAHNILGNHADAEECAALLRDFFSQKRK